MKYFLGLFLLVSFYVGGQNSSLGVTAFGHVTFLGEMNPTTSYGAGVSILWKFGQWRALSLAFGASSGQYTHSGNHTKIENGVVIYDNNWSYTIYQQVAPLDLLYMEDVLASPRHHLYIGGGASVLFHSFEHPNQVVFDEQWVVAPNEMVQSKATEFAVNVVLSYSWDFSKHWFFESRATLRLPIPQRELLAQASNLMGLPGVNSSFIPSIYLGLDYRF